MATLKELADDYEAAAVLLRKRLKEIRDAKKVEQDPDKCWHLNQRTKELTPMLTYCNKMQDICRDYYQAPRDPKYTMARGEERKTSSGQAKKENSDQ